MTDVSTPYPKPHLVKPHGLYDQLETDAAMQEESLPANLVKRLEELKGREASYWEDEMYSVEALTNLEYREELERCFKIDPLGPLPPRQ